MIARTVSTIAAARYGCCVANHVMPIAKASSARLRNQFDAGSGDALTAVRAASFPLCAASAIEPPTSPDSNCAPSPSGCAAA